MNQRNVETFLHTGIKDELLPECIEGFDPGVEFIHRLLENCPVVATHPLAQKGFIFGAEDPYGPDSDDEIELVQLTRNHGRSFEVCHPDAQGVWRDEFGNLYSSINLKGNNFSNPHVMKTFSAPDGYIAFGLQESSVSRRVLRASRILRENGIGTEYILGMAEPKAFGWPTADNRTNSLEFLDLPVYKQKLVEESWMRLGDKQKTAETYVEMARAFEQMTFLISARAMDTSYRFYDVMHNTEAANVVFSLINEHYRDPSLPNLHPADSRDMREYVTDYVVPAAVKNLAKLHKLGLAHRFPNALNITGLGSLVDLDSVHGEILDLGDAPITVSDIAIDLLYLAEGLRDFGLFALFSMTEEAVPETTDLVVNLYISEMREQFAASGQSDEDFKAYILSLTAAIHHQATAMAGGDSDMLAAQLEKKFLDAYAEMTNQPDIDEANQLVEAWVDTYWDQLRPHIEQKVIDDIPAALDKLLENYMNEHSVGLNFDPVQELFSGKSQAARVARYWLHTDALFALSFMYMDHISEEPTLKGDQAFERGVVEHLITTDYADWEGKFSDRVQVLIEDAMSKYIAARTPEDTKPEIPYLFEDKKSCALFLIKPGEYMYETSGVSVQDIRDYLDVTESEVTLEPFDSSLPVLSTVCETTKDGSRLIQVITELPTEGSSYVEGSREPKVELELAELGYVMFVELKPDGNQRLRIQHPDAGLLQQRQHLSPKQIAEFLLARSMPVQDGLFDKDPYYKPKKPAFEIGFVVSEEMRKYLQI